MLSCLNLSKKYGKVLFNELNINLEKGEILAIIGPSGCGKTTLLRCICGLEELDSGKILLNGADITKIPAEERGIGLLFQKPVLYPHLTVSGNLSLASFNNHDKALVEVGLPNFEDRDVDTLSGGEGQRVALARALLANPNVLLLDEPFSALDLDMSIKLINDVRALLKDRSCSAILVTHNIEEAKLFSDRMIDLSKV
ncbi:MAG: ATP-binding cassette domain-containing protein [Candidatus Thermoplasmatota archaeon]|nr:ATP-binding cassette domain-containing protein [Candidatus Thermoplasmatota archaeon]